jgi:predicted nucleic acid-binding protein
MRVVIDTNIFVSALIASGGKPAAIVDAWLDGKFTVLTCAKHVAELRTTLHKPRVAELIKPYKAGRLVNQVKKLAEDDFLLAMSQGGQADYLVTGDKRGLLALGRHKATRIVSAGEFAALFAW